MWRSTILELYLTVLLLSALRPSREDADIPASVKAVKGSCVLVPCKSPPYVEIHWYKYASRGYPTVYSKKTEDVIDQFRGRTSVPGKANEGNCTLRIDNIRQEDDVEVYVYFSRYEGINTKINILEPETRISVQSSVEEGKVFHAFCTVRHSCPPSPPRIEWLGLKSATSRVSHTRSGDGLWIAQASGTFRASWEDHGRNLSCRSRMNETYVPAVNPVVLSVSYSPKNIRIYYVREDVVAEGGSIGLLCHSTSNPTPAEYEWHVSPNNSVTRTKENNVTLRYIGRGASVSCTAINAAGRGTSEPLSLNVTFSPVILPDSFCSYQGENLHCVCQVETNPPANITWIVNGSLATSPHFNITTEHSGLGAVSEITVPPGNVTCSARNALGESFHQVPVRSGLWKVVLGAGAAVSIIGIAVTAGVCFRRRRRQADKSEEDNDKKTTIDHKHKCETDLEVYVNEAQTRREPPKEPDVYENFFSK